MAFDRPYAARRDLCNLELRARPSPEGKPPGALRSRVLWSASSWPSCLAASLLFSLMVPFADARLRRSGRPVISRRRFLTAGALALAPIGAAAHAQQYKAQQADKIARIGYLGTNLALPGARTPYESCL